jgi:hypothetical protein
LDRGRFLPKELPLTGRRIRIAALWPVCAGGLLLLAGGCGLFDPRDPKPSTSPGTGCHGLTSPDSLIANVQEHYGSPPGLTCFSTVLDDGFLFHPDIQDSIDALPDSIYRTWNREIETRVATGLAADAAFCSTVFDSEYAARSVSTDQRTEVRFYAYHLRFRAKSAPDTTRYQGLADLTFHQESGIWHLTTWVDKRDASGLATWGTLRRDYRTGF